MANLEEFTSWINFLKFASQLFHSIVDNLVIIIVTFTPIVHWA